jgi:hypothetical protein
MHLENYGETIAYWYLRLNGFFPLSRFVLHRHDLAVEHSADCDFLAIRHPNVYEVIGGQRMDWDLDRFTNWGIDLEQDAVGLFVEVKTGLRGADLEEGIERAFSADRITYAIQRTGFWPSDSASVIEKHLQSTPIFREDEHPMVFGKLLVSANEPRADHVPPHLYLPLIEADQFIINRMQLYKKHKFADRHFFPSDLIQYIIWKQTTGD